jgi:hypothetical protein
MRDDFSEDIKRIIASRVNYRCSNPSCRVATSGPQVHPEKALNIGVAAHITAASPGGPRYDSSQTPNERRHASNAIWLCQNCAKLIDNDEARFTVSELRRWKADAEAEAFAQIGKATVSRQPRRASLEYGEARIVESAGADGFLTVDSTPFLGDKGKIWEEHIADSQSVKSLLDILWSKLRPHLPAHTYGYIWVLRDQETGNVYWDLAIDLEAYHGLGREAKSLREARIESGMTLEIVPLSGAAKRPNNSFNPSPR